MAESFKQELQVLITLQRDATTVLANEDQDGTFQNIASTQHRNSHSAIKKICGEFSDHNFLGNAKHGWVCSRCEKVVGPIGWSNLTTPVK